MADPILSVTAGADVGNSKLDAHIRDRDFDRLFNNDKPGRRDLSNWPLNHSVSCTVFKPAGRYRRNLH